MLRERYSKDEFEKIFQAFNTAVYNGEMKKLNYKSWKNIKNWLSDEAWSKMEVSKEWVRIRDDNDTNPYAYHDEERIFVGPYDPVSYCPNPEELNLNDNSFGTWLDRVLNKEDMIANLPNSLESIGYSAVQAADSCLSLSDAGYADAISACDTYTKLSTHDQHIYTTLQDWQPGTINLNTDGLQVSGDSLKEYIEKTVNKINDNAKKKENNKMLKFDFGPVDPSVRMSLYGMAIKNASGAYVAYDKATKQIMDVDILNFEGANKFIYKMPATLAQIAAGDVVIHARKPMFVQKVREDNRLSVMDIFDGEEKVIVPSVSPFGFNFVTKVVSLFDFSNATADESNPFGSMLPFLLMSDSKSDNTDMLMMFALMGGKTDLTANPLMMYALMNKDGKNNDMLPFLLMGGFDAKPNGCGGNCSCHKDK